MKKIIVIPVSILGLRVNEKTYGMRTGELVCFTSGAGMGKSSIIRELNASPSM
jgi:guanylate kinase